MSNRPRKEIVGAPRWRQLGTVIGLTVLLGMMLGCGERSPAGPTPTPVRPVTPAPGVYTVTAGANTVAPGGQLSVSWTASTGRPKDWISLFRVGDPNEAHGWAEYTEGATAGTFTLSAPSQAGQYEFRYLLDDGFYDVARSSVVTVGAGAEPLRVLPR